MAARRRPAAKSRSTQDLMLLSGLPPVVRESDRYRATFTLRNASERRMPVQLIARVASGGKAFPPLEPRQVELAPGEAREIAWVVTVPIDATKLDWQVEAVERAHEAAEQPVRPEPVEGRTE